MEALEIKKLTSKITGDELIVVVDNEEGAKQFEALAEKCKTFVDFTSDANGGKVFASGIEKAANQFISSLQYAKELMGEAGIPYYVAILVDDEVNAAKEIVKPDGNPLADAIREILGI